MFEKRLLLPENLANCNERTFSSNGGSISNSATTSDDDDFIDDILERQHIDRKSNTNGNGKNKSLLLQPLLLNGRPRFHLYRGLRRFGRITILTSFIFLMLYLMLYTNAQTRQNALRDWGYNTSRNIGDYVLPDNNTTLIEPHNICKDKVFLIIIVCSGINNFVERQAIRETWGNVTEFNYGMFRQMHAHLKGRYLEPSISHVNHYREYLGMNETQMKIPSHVPVRVAFLIGTQLASIGNETMNRIRAEVEQYNDIIQENFIDSYNNLTIKSVLALKWLNRNCLKNAAFYMKCDVDTFVHVPNLIHILLGGTLPLYNSTLELYDIHTYQALYPTNRLKATNGILIGHLFCSSRPIANVSSKWYMPHYMYPDDQYPRYLSGAGYVMSIDVVPRLYEIALNTSLIYMEDIYLTGVCAERIHIQRHNHPVFCYTYSKDLCTYKGIITQHDLKDDARMLEAYAFVRNATQICPAPENFFRVVRLRKANKCV